MHITAIDAALATALITACAGILGGLYVQWATRTREHATRIWDRQAEIYYSALLDAHQLTSKREECIEYMHNVRPEGGVVDLGAGTPMKHSERLELQTRLTLFGSYNVQDAYTKFLEAHNTWSDAWNKMIAAARVPSESKEEIAKRRGQVREAHMNATRRRTDLIFAIHADVRKLPSRIRLWR